MGGPAGGGAGRLSGAEHQEDFAADFLVELVDGQRSLALVAEHSKTTGRFSSVTSTRVSST